MKKHLKTLTFLLISPLFLASCFSSNNPEKKYSHEGVHYHAFDATLDAPGNKEFYYCSLHNEYSATPLENGNYIDSAEKPSNVPYEFLIPMIDPFIDKNEIINKIYDFGVPKTFDIKRYPEVLSLQKDILSRGVDNIETYITNYSNLLELVKYISENLEYYNSEDEFKIISSGDITTYSRLKTDEIYGNFYSFATNVQASSGTINFDIGDNQIDLDNTKELFFYIYSPVRQSISYCLKNDGSIVLEKTLSKEWNLISFNMNDFSTSNLRDLSINFTDLSRTQGIEDFKITRLFLNGSHNSTSNY